MLLAAIMSLVAVTPSLAQDITFERPHVGHSISVEADEILRWNQGQYEMLQLNGNVRINQDSVVGVSDRAILWVDVPPASADLNHPDSADLPRDDVYKVIVYLEGNASIGSGSVDRESGQPRNRIIDEKWLGRLFTTSTVDLASEATNAPANHHPALFERALKELNQPKGNVGWPTEPTSVQQTAAQFDVGDNSPPMLVSPQTGQIMQVPAPQPQQPFPTIDTPYTNPNAVPDIYSPAPPPSTYNGPQPTIGTVADTPVANNDSRISISARDAKTPLNFKSIINPDNPDERITILGGGVRIAIDAPQIASNPQFRGDVDQKVIILADNVVQWQTTLPDGRPVSEFYVEGDVVFAKDRRVIYAEKMYYNVNSFQGTILNAEVLTPVPQYRGLVRLKANVVQQVDQNNLQAYGSAFTSSRLGFPRYWLQSESISLQRQDAQAIDPQTGEFQFDPQTGAPVIGNDYFVESNRNQVYLAGRPIFYWPSFRTNLSNPSMYLRRFGVNNDNIFGFQVRTGFDLYQILGLKNPPRGTELTGLLDYLSERGVGFGTELNYNRPGFLGLPGIARGQSKAWYINDNGTDNLGRGRRNLTPEEEFRGRSILNHRQNFAPGFQLRAEFGYISDRNFLEQYYERQWDTQKDATTGIWLERNIGTHSYNLTADVQINDFFTQTSWLPRLDHFNLGRAFGNDRFVLNSHSQAGYGKLRVASTPTDPLDAAAFDPLAWEADVEGFRVGTRHEISAPSQLGPVKVAPYALGDVTYWQEDLSGSDLLRGYGQVGVRASLPVWKIDPSVQSTIFNLNGLAHKVSFDVDAFVSDASQDLGDLALYDQIDDDAQEHFRRRFAFNTFGIAPGGDVPLKFDERFFALRSNLQGNVTSPSAEIADDLAEIKFGVRQRWQTKRGGLGRERIIDVATLDMQATVFPDSDRDNFGSGAGMFDYDFRWHLGDRVALVSDGYADSFEDGLRTISVGAFAERPEIGNVYVGVRSIEGPISSNILSATTTYRMSDKWGIKAGSQVDFGETGTIGNRLGVIYIGESFLYSFGFSYDASRDNFGFRFGFEPRFAGKPRLFRPGNTSIPPAGARWLE